MAKASEPKPFPVGSTCVRVIAVAIAASTASAESMKSMLLEHWSECAKETGEFLVFPDGCRDLILRQKPGQAAHWLASTLMTSPTLVKHVAGEHFQGYRLQPGCLINEAALQKQLQNAEADQIDIATLLVEAVHYHDNTSEMLAAITAGLSDINAAARSQGVSLRTFQRHLKKITGQSATFWWSLSRARRAGRQLSSKSPLHNIAFEAGYSDQSHMTREFRRWFNTPPAAMRHDSKQLESLMSSGIG